MSGLVQLTRDDDVAIIAIDNPPVNALSSGVREGLFEAMERVYNDASFQATVIMGAGRTFVAGADIHEFEKMVLEAPREAILPPLLLRIEDCSRPVIMAIHGTALGGGLELALAGHYRVASPDAQLGQPEVKLGLIPGGGATQRLPRLAGVAIAAQMCSEGTTISAVEALRNGIIDHLIEGDLLAGALTFARQVAGRPIVKVRERTGNLNSATRNTAVLAAARERLGSKKRHLLAPLAALEAVEAATRLSFEEGCRVERRLFLDCLYSDQSKALIHVFFGEREVAKVAGVGANRAGVAVNHAAVVGSGTMGSGIAMVLADAGIPVLLKGLDQPALDQGLTAIRNSYATAVKRGRLAQKTVDQRLALITPTLSYARFHEVDLIIEAVFENMSLKRQVFHELNDVCRQGAVLATNTSTLSIDEIADATERSESVLGMHFFCPAERMRLLEIVRGQKTSSEVIATGMQLAKRLGKVGVVVRNCRGFVGNRMFGAYRREAQFLVEEGAEVEALDEVLVDFGMAMGPLATGDLAGLDVGWRIRQEYRDLEKPGVRRPMVEDRLYELGRHGRKVQAGWYRYDENQRALPDPEVTALVRGWAADAGIVQRPVANSEIIERCIYALVNEGARILDEGIAQRPVDIDIICLYGYGFPAHRGGPMWYADTVGLENVYRRVCEFHQQFGEVWTPAPLLKRLAQQKQTFAGYHSHALAQA